MHKLPYTDGFAASTGAASGPKKLLSGPAAAVHINTLAYVDEPCTGCGKKSSPLKFFAIFLATA